VLGLKRGTRHLKVTVTRGDGLGAAGRVQGRRLLRDASPGLHEPLRLSVGAILAEDDETVAAVLHRADAAMYRAKAASKQSAATSSS